MCIRRAHSIFLPLLPFALVYSSMRVAVNWELRLPLPRNCPFSASPAIIVSPNTVRPASEPLSYRSARHRRRFELERGGGNESSKLAKKKKQQQHREHMFPSLHFPPFSWRCASPSPSAIGSAQYLPGEPSPRLTPFRANRFDTTKRGAEHPT